MMNGMYTKVNVITFLNPTGDMCAYKCRHMSGRPIKGNCPATTFTHAVGVAIFTKK